MTNIRLLALLFLSYIISERPRSNGRSNNEFKNHSDAKNLMSCLLVKNSSRIFPDFLLKSQLDKFIYFKLL